jgi:phage baseplate assembly protein W
VAGMNRETGQRLSDGWPHTVQSIMDIISTPKFTRVWRREYGGPGAYLQDKPATQETLLEFTSVIGEAIIKWEPRYRLYRMWFEDANQSGSFILNIDGVYYPNALSGDFDTGVWKGVEVPWPMGMFITGAV